MVSTGTPEAKETDRKDYPDGSPLEMKVKTEREQSKDSMEMLAYFDKLPDNTREELLSQLCLQDNPCASTTSELQPKKNLEEHRSEMDNASDATHTDRDLGDIKVILRKQDHDAQLESRT